MSNTNPQSKTPWGTIIIMGIIVWFALGYYFKRQEEARERARIAEQSRRNAEDAGAFIGGVLRELSK